MLGAPRQYQRVPATYASLFPLYCPTGPERSEGLAHLRRCISTTKKLWPDSSLAPPPPKQKHEERIVGPNSRSKASSLCPPLQQGQANLAISPTYWCQSGAAQSSQQGGYRHTSSAARRDEAPRPNQEGTITKGLRRFSARRRPRVRPRSTSSENSF